MVWSCLVHVHVSVYQNHVFYCINTEYLNDVNGARIMCTTVRNKSGNTLHVVCNQLFINLIPNSLTII